MRKVEYKKLRKSAQDAIKKGDGKHGKFLISGNGKYVAIADETGRAMEWIEVTRQFRTTTKETNHGKTSRIFLVKCGIAG